MTLEEEARRGERARRLLDDPLLQEAFAAVEEHLRTAAETGRLAERQHERAGEMT